MNGGSGEDSVTSTFTARWKYYFIWSISEASIIISGLGFSGWTDENTQTKAKWDRAKNVDILGVELAKSAVQIPLVWNIQVSTWLRHYVYERIVKPGKTAGFFPLLATQTVSAMWHGLYPGYIIFFVQSALMIDGSKGYADSGLNNWTWQGSFKAGEKRQARWRWQLEREDCANVRKGKELDQRKQSLDLKKVKTFQSRPKMLGPTTSFLSLPVGPSLILLRIYVKPICFFPLNYAT
ncbi:lysophospholipid acyltransferase 2-like isoform X2 [Brassica napus]|nr:lysophospholipid acyltransferase 2-like isoform X2 [Brassica napus]